MQLCVLTPLEVPLEVATVGRDGVRRQSPLDLDVSEVSADGLPEPGQASTSATGVKGMSNASATAP